MKISSYCAKANLEIANLKMIYDDYYYGINWMSLGDLMK